MKFKPENHIIGKAYDLTQENMQAMLIHIDKLEEELDAALMALGLEQKENARLREALKEIADQDYRGNRPTTIDIARAALEGK